MRASVVTGDRATVDGVAIAADVRGVATAEALAHEFVARLRLWGGGCPSRIVWRTLAAPLEGGGAHKHARQSVPEALRRALKNLRGFEQLPALGCAALRFPVSRDVHLAAVWRRRAARGDDAGYWVPDADGAWGSFRATHPLLPYATLPDPFEPLLAILQLGYALDAVTDEAIVLLAPEDGDRE